MYTPAVVEFLGTALIIGAVAFLQSPVMVVAATAIAIGLGGKISGGHFNPALTAWALLAGKISQEKAITYMFSQFAAGLLIFFVSTITTI